MALTACFHLLQSGRVHVEADGRLRRGRLRRRGFCARPPLDFADERRASIFGVHGAIVSQQQIPSDEGRPALVALEGALFGICSDDEDGEECSLAN